MPAKKVATKKTTTKPTPKPKAKPKVVMYASKKLNMCHPEFNVRFTPGIPVACEMDSWLESQIDAGLIEKC